MSPFWCSVFKIVSIGFLHKKQSFASLTHSLQKPPCPQGIKTLFAIRSMQIEHFNSLSAFY